jgi:hypothetical protein
MVWQRPEELSCRLVHALARVNHQSILMSEKNTLEDRLTTLIEAKRLLSKIDLNCLNVLAYYLSIDGQSTSEALKTEKSLLQEHHLLLGENSFAISSLLHNANEDSLNEMIFESLNDKFSCSGESRVEVCTQCFICFVIL